MEALQILLIEHDDVRGLYPFSELHCSWELRTGVYSVIERWGACFQNVPVTVSSHRELHLQSYLERFPGTNEFSQTPTLVISGHVLLSPAEMKRIVGKVLGSTAPALIICNGNPVGAYIPSVLASALKVVEYLDGLSPDSCEHIEISGVLLERVWHTLECINQSIEWDATLVPSLVSSSATIHSTAVLDDSSGPVIIGPDARIDAYAVLRGPVSIGSNSTVNVHANIRSTVVGPACKVGGEISNSILMGYSNKQHEGFLGHSFLCEWVNLGAGTITSNLKNTYGSVNIKYPWGKERTDRVFLGSILGDHSKTAIGTLLMCGSIVGVSSTVMSSASPEPNIGNLRWIDGTQYGVEKAVEVARTVMQRRDCMLSPSSEMLIRVLTE